jgi:succinate dehydrogenase / fumarate reductase cytochrome b subunit
MSSKTVKLYSTTVGKKAIMAASGVILVGYALIHMLGNLQIYQGAEAINTYSAFLHSKPLVLWVARIVLLVAFVLHVYLAVQLWWLNRGARTDYQYPLRRTAATPLERFASRTMIWTGPIFLVYLVFHIVHLTLGASMGDYETHAHDVYANLVNGFSVWWVAIVYIIANLALGLHLFHGIWSMAQTAGLNHKKYNQLIWQIAAFVVAIIAFGNVSIPFAVWTGAVTL